MSNIIMGFKTGKFLLTLLSPTCLISLDAMFCAASLVVCPNRLHAPISKLLLEQVDYLVCRIHVEVDHTIRH